MKGETKGKEEKNNTYVDAHHLCQRRSVITSTPTQM